MLPRCDGDTHLRAGINLPRAAVAFALGVHLVMCGAMRALAFQRVTALH